MDASIKLTRFESNDAELPLAQRHAWPITILAEGTNIPSEIFVYHVGKAGDPFPDDTFTCVASVNQMLEIPKYRGISLTTVTGIPYYRISTLELICRSAEEVEEVWTKAQEEVEALVKNWNSAARMQGTAIVRIGQTITEYLKIEMNPPIRYQLSYHPAGTATYSVGVQGITSPDTSKKGWLPMASKPAAYIAPAGALFFYNIDQDAGLKAIWPPKDPFSGHMLHRNGIQMPYDLVFSLTKDTIWWLQFLPSTLPGYDRVTPQVEDGNAPWPTDYVSTSSPGAVAPIVAITLFT